MPKVELVSNYFRIFSVLLLCNPRFTFFTVIFIGSQAQAIQQGKFESVHRDLIVSLGAWEFNPLNLDNPFPNNEGSVHLWQGDEDRLVPVTMQRYIAQQLPWIKYHELSGSGHMFPYAVGMADAIVKELLLGENSKPQI